MEEVNQKDSRDADARRHDNDHDAGEPDNVDGQDPGEGPSKPTNKSLKNWRIPKRAAQDPQGTSKRQKQDAPGDVSPAADDGPRAESSSSPSSDSSGEEESDADSDSDSSSSSEGEVVVKQPPRKEGTVKPVYSRFNPGVGDELVFHLPNAEMVGYATDRFTLFVTDRKLKESILDEYPVPKGVPGLEVPVVDDYIVDIFATRKYDYGKQADECWTKVQHRIVDIMGPLGKLWATLDGARQDGDPSVDSEPVPELDLFECLEMVEKCITLVGQSHITVSFFRRQNILNRLTQDPKKAKQLLKQYDVTEAKSYNKLFGKHYYKKLHKSAKVKKVSKEISSQFSDSKRYSKKSSGNGNKGRQNDQQPFQAGPSSGGRGGGQKVAFVKRGKGSGKRGKFLVKFSALHKISKKSKKIRRGRRNKSPNCRVPIKWSNRTDCDGLRRIGLKDIVLTTQSPPPTSGLGSRICQSTRLHRGEVKILSKQLDKTDHRPVCTDGSEGTKDPLCGTTPSGQGNPSVSPVQQGLSPDRVRDIEHVGERGYSGSPACTKSICQSTVLGPQKGRVTETSDKSEKAEQLCQLSAFQDGGTSSIERADTAKRLDDEGGSQGCLLQRPCGDKPSAIPSFSVGQEAVSVSVHALRAGTSPKIFHQDLEASSGVSETVGDQDHNLLRRYDHSQPIETGPTEGSELFAVLTNALRVCDQLEEVLPGTDPDLGFLGFYHQYNHDGVVPARGQNSEDCSEMSESNYRKDSNCQIPGRNGGVINCFSESNSPSSSALSSNADVSSKSSVGGTVLRDEGNFVCGGPPRVEMVDRSHQGLEWQSHYNSFTRLDCGDRCQLTGLGGSVAVPQNRGTLECGGEKTPYKCSGAQRSSLRGEIICERSSEHPHSLENGQCVRSHLHTEDGGNEIPTSTVSGWGPLGLLLREEHHPFSGISPWSSQRESRLGIETFHRFQRLETGGIDVQGHQFNLGTSENRPICEQTEYSVASIRQLEARSVCSISRRISDELGYGGDLYIPPLLDDCSLSSKNIQRQSNCNFSDSSLAVPVVVSNTVGNVCRPSSTVTSDSTVTNVPKGRVSSSRKRGGEAYR